ncbi:g1946 [Coccomyxa elongata]
MVNGLAGRPSHVRHRFPSAVDLNRLSGREGASGKVRPQRSNNGFLPWKSRPGKIGNRQCVCKAESQRQPDISLECGGVPIHIFGVQHCERQPYIGEHILRHRPSTVVVETAISPTHGAASGNTFTCSRLAQDSIFFERLFCQVSAQLAQMPDPTSTRLWQDLQRQFMGEQLVYIAGLAVEAQIVYGDRVKADTYRRLDTVPSIVDLDRAFGLQSVLNYEEMVSGRPAVVPPAQRGCVEHILLTERDAVLCQSLAEAAHAQRPNSKPWQRSLVVGAVGEAHLEGIAELWQDSRWRDVVKELNTGSKCGSAVRDPMLGEYGVRRALLESVVRLSCRDSVTADLAIILEPLPEAELPSYQLTHELYGSTRMLLACLTNEQLAQVCSGWRCDMEEVLAPVRNARPLNGGSGCDVDLILELRTLHFELQ